MSATNYKIRTFIILINLEGYAKGNDKFYNENINLVLSCDQFEMPIRPSLVC